MRNELAVERDARLRVEVELGRARRDGAAAAADARVVYAGTDGADTLTAAEHAVLAEHRAQRGGGGGGADGGGSGGGGGGGGGRAGSPATRVDPAHHQLLIGQSHRFRAEIDRLKRLDEVGPRQSCPPRHPSRMNSSPFVAMSTMPRRGERSGVRPALRPGAVGCAAGGARRGGSGGPQGRAVQVDPITPTLSAPGTKRSKLRYDESVSSFAFTSACAATARRRRRSRGATPPSR